MDLSPTPDLGSPRRLALTALAVTLVISTVLLLRGAHALSLGLGDSDDAMRLVLARDLLGGRGWYDQLITRLQPPAGAYLHWSRLVDGGLAGLMWLAGRVVSPPQAELAARILWPLLWMFPAVASALVCARSLPVRGAVLTTAILMAFDYVLYRQFEPGRVDHHNVQITMLMLALAVASAPRPPVWAAALGGAASALGLAVGLEALPYHALVGASFAVRLAADPAGRRPAAAYGLALALGGLAFYGVQTPPSRWSLSACDAIGANLVASLSLAGLGLAAVAGVSQRLSRTARIAALGGLGATVALAYVVLDPACLHGPFAGLDPRVRPFWFDRIQEIEPWPKIFAAERPIAIRSMITLVMSLAAALLLLARRRTLGGVLLSTCIAAAGVAAFNARRMEDYVYWIGMPLVGAVLAAAGERWLRGRLVPTVALTAALSPIFVSMAVNAAAAALWPRAMSYRPAAKAPACFSAAAYARLAALPKGVVLADPDVGTYILAHTPHAAVTAPYHRLAGSILAAHEALEGPAALAADRIQRLGVAYIFDCPGRPAAPGGLLADLRRGEIPAWLAPVTAPTESPATYRVRARPAR